MSQLQVKTTQLVCDTIYTFLNLEGDGVEVRSISYVNVDSFFSSFVWVDLDSSCIFLSHKIDSMLIQYLHICSNA